MRSAREANGQEDWTIVGKLVSKKLFSKWSPRSNRQITVMTLTLLDEAGDLIDFETWNRRKAYCVYRKVHEDNCYFVNGKGEFIEPNKQYSTSKYLTKRWQLIEPDEDVSIKKYLRCSTVLQNTINNKVENNEADNIVGVYLGTVKGRDTRAVRGYYAKLGDEKGRVYYVLLWHAPRLDKASKFALFNCEVGDTVLVQNARKSYPPIDPSVPKLYTLTSLNPPILNSECVQRKRIHDLQTGFKNNSASNGTGDSVLANNNYIVTDYI